MRNVPKSAKTKLTWILCQRNLETNINGHSTLD